MANPALIPPATPSLVGLIDAIQQRLTQAHATASLLMLTVDETFNHHEISNVLWAVTTLLEQATTASGDAHKGYTDAINRLEQVVAEQAAMIRKLRSEQAELSENTAAILHDVGIVFRQNPHLLASSPRFACPKWDMAILAGQHRDRANALRQ